MTIAKRHNFKWSINEINSLQREYELLELDPKQIAKRHNRSVLAILFKLRQEGIIDDIARNGWRFQKSASGATWNQNLSSSNEEEEYEEDDEDVDEESLSDSSSECSYNEEDEDESSFRDNINKRMLRLEESLDDMKDMITHIFTKLKKNKSLRSYQI
jgi:hypothetical protein